MTRAALVLAAAAASTVAVAGCAGGSGHESAEQSGCAAEDGGALPDDSTPAIAAALSSPLAPPSPAGKGSIAREPPVGSRPSRRPVQAAEPLRGHPLPTNQWWASALVGPWTQPLIAGPVAVRIEEPGVAISYRPPEVQEDHVIQPFVPSVVAGGPLEGVEVACYGSLHVVLESRLRGGGTLRVTLVQGSPVVWLGFSGAREASLRLQGSVTGLRISGSRLESTVDGRRWALGADSGSWARSGDAIVLEGAEEEVMVAVAPAPDGGGEEWARVVEAAAGEPVLHTEETLTYEPRRRVARQVLTAERAGGRGGLWALTPLQARNLVEPRAARRLGSYPTSTGRMVLVEARSLAVEVPAPGFLPGVPRVALARVARDAVRRALRADLAESAEGGSYFGAKELARLAGIAEVAAAIGDGRARARALARLRAGLVDWLTYGGPEDGRYLAYDPVWGGLVPVPSEFGAHDYDDHHFQLGYLVRSAAVLAEADAGFARAYGSVVDAVVSDFAGARAGLVDGGFPSERVWNAGAGHSWASGYALFADGQNQESSSEAVAAWAAVARWGLATGRPEPAGLGLARYALEAAAARTYWLGEQPAIPRGYRHRVVGIVWGAKVDHATWFSPEPAAIHGIQLLPAGFDSLYRFDPGAARERVAALLAETGGRISQWANLLAVERALFDPAGARRLLDARLPEPEPSTGRAIAGYLVETLALTGPPDPSVTADGPYGLAMRRAGTLSLLTANPTDQAVVVRFRRGDDVVARVRVPAHGSRFVRVDD